MFKLISDNGTIDIGLDSGYIGYNSKQYKVAKDIVEIFLGKLNMTK